MQKRKLPRDANSRAAMIVAMSTGQLSDKEKSGPPSTSPVNAAAVTLGRLGGLKGGKARAAALSKKKRSEIAKLAATARWKKS